MQPDPVYETVSRRQLLTLIGSAAGGAALYQATTSLGLASESPYQGPIKLDGDPKGASVLVLGAGIAGMAAALELRQAGYHVQVLEYDDRPGGRVWTLRGDDSVTELGDAAQTCEFERGLYFNAGPWRIPHHHRGVLDYCRQLGVALEPFEQLNHNAYLHSARAFGGRPQRIREIKADFRGHVSELLAKVAQQGKLDAAISREDQEILLEALKSWGALDDSFAYAPGRVSAAVRGYAEIPGASLGAAPVPGEPIGLSDILTSRLWSALRYFDLYTFQTTMLQPVGGMDRIAKAFADRLGGLIRYRAKITRVRQSERAVTVLYEDAKTPGETQQASADWCVCTIPLSILREIPVDASAPLKAAIAAVPYGSSEKVGLQFRRRFWEDDEAIYGGISFTDLPIQLISYPSSGFNRGGKGILIGAYTWGRSARAFTAMPPAERIAHAVALGAQIHPQYRQEFEAGVSVAWDRVPFARGAGASWSEELRNEHYDNLCRIDGRIVLAGEHASYLPSWMEGAIVSALDAVSRLHRRVLAG